MTTYPYTRSLIFSSSSGVVSLGSIRLLLVVEMMFMATMRTVSVAWDPGQLVCMIFAGVQQECNGGVTDDGEEHEVVVALEFSP